MLKKKKDVERPVCVYVEYYRATSKEVRELERYLKDYEAVAGTGRVARKARGGIELGTVFTVYLLPVLVSYAGTKLLTIIEDRVKEWFKEHGREEQFILLNLSGQKRSRTVGKGRPRRGDKY